MVWYLDILKIVLRNRFDCVCIYPTSVKPPATPSRSLTNTDNHRSQTQPRENIPE